VVQGAWDAGPLAALRLMRACHPYLKGDGAIVNISSGIAIADRADNRGIYAAVKAALNAISRAAANEWGCDGIRTNVVMPFARTDKVDAFFANEPALSQAILGQNPLGRLGECEADIGRAVAFLVGPDASYINGVTLPVDGGSSYVR
jgi:NAD(P)-dependent dehydrogenase (short-subunit alcohol dehydrogenase family)